jgi:hypothetical protein
MTIIDDLILTVQSVAFLVQITPIVHGAIEMSSFVIFMGLMTQYFSSIVMRVCFAVLLYLFLNMHEFVGL